MLSLAAILPYQVQSMKASHLLNLRVELDVVGREETG